MTDLKLAAQDAIFDKLSAALAGLNVPVYQHAPENQEPPVVLIGAMRAEPVGGKDGGLDRIEMEILSYVRAPGREHLTPVMTLVRETLEEQPLTADDVLLSAPVFEGDEDDLDEDGQTYVGVQRFSLFAQPDE